MKRAARQFIFRVSILILLALLAFIINRFGAAPDTGALQQSVQSGTVEVHFIDVGQGDSILIEAENAAMLVDAGENNKGSVVINYLNRQNIKKLDYVIGTHPHSDHIGGMDVVIEELPVANVIMPMVSHTTTTYEDVLDAALKKGLTINKPVVGDTYELGPATFTILAPNSSSYEDLNNYSIVIKLTFGNISFLLSGDAEAVSEKEMLDSGLKLSANVLKIGHHGSASSSTDRYLDAVDPNYAVISVGADNIYGHPHPDVLEAIQSRNIRLYRTDKQGTVVFTTDGTNISVNTKEYINKD